MYSGRYLGTSYRRREPVGQGYNPNRVELNVLKLDADGNSVYDDEFDPDVCRCFPRTSKKTIPSMLYDHINCPHVDHKHIQPAQQYVFTYPWTASSGKGHQRARRDFDQYSKLSAIGEDDEWENNVTRTAPPFARNHSPSAHVPYSAPVPGENTRHATPGFRQFGSTQSLTGYTANRRTPTANRRGTHAQNAEPSTPLIVNRQHDEGYNARYFQGHYVDPKDGSVYKYNVKYGKRDVQATREKDDTYR